MRRPKVKHSELGNDDMTRCDAINAWLAIASLALMLMIIFHRHL